MFPPTRSYSQMQSGIPAFHLPVPLSPAFLPGSWFPRDPIPYRRAGLNEEHSDSTTYKGEVQVSSGMDSKGCWKMLYDPLWP